ncbi:uncharacterized protein LOC126687627 [Mercurialis annua]|uniref:uncharacterized protein LOC126687627 n=1 Tax=Mercurialis annua TaxID=3986 RepID=UPI00215ED18B|nr:uncharacterized protein LOC126687627 [Mercurialis annua]
MRAAEEDICPGNSRHFPFSASAKVMEIKCRHKGSVALVDDICGFIQELLPEDNKMPTNFAKIKKLVKGLGLPVEVIDCSFYNCMIYWGEDADLTHCKVCNYARWKPVTHGKSAKRKANVPYSKMFYFPITLRLQRLYASKATARHMTWHADHEMDGDKMCHPSDSPAWKHFSELHSEFADEGRHIRLGLCSDGFQPFTNFGQQYSSWPVILTPYNLPPGLCMKDEFMLLTILVPGPRNPKHLMDIFLQPLVAELNQLWECGVQTYDVHKRQNFQLKAALMWTINDFPAYSMLSGWSTAGRKACPYCMENTDAFTLDKRGKQSWFDCHRKFLPPNHQFRRNVTDFRKGKREIRKRFAGVRTGDELLAEIDRLGFKKAFELGAKVTNALLSKDHGWNKKKYLLGFALLENEYHAKSHEELNDICDRPGLAKDPATGRFLKAIHALDRDSKRVLHEWIQKIKFPDGYASNLSRYVDLKGLKMHGMKSHDCHVFMQRLLPIALRELLTKNVWEPITELSIFFRKLTFTSLSQEDLNSMESEIPKILCKLERIFPPSFFDSMEHLSVHLPYEAMMAGPVTNKGRVEGSISSGYLQEEISKFASYYFAEGDPMIPVCLGRNETCDMDIDDDVDRLGIFKPKGKPLRGSGRRYFEDDEIITARTYVLLNCSEIEDHRKVFVAGLRERNNDISETEIERVLESDFASWFEQYVKDPTVCTNPFILSLAKGPCRKVTTYKGYYVNGFKFLTQEYGQDQLTMNSGVCVRGTEYVDGENDFYGVLTGIIELEYPALPMKQTVIFKCEWFDPMDIGTDTSNRYNLVDVNHRCRYNKYEPFILAEQADQVHYLPYPSRRRDKVNWWEVCKIKARS